MAARRAVVGIDLAGSDRRNTGIAVLAGKSFLHVSEVHSDGEILSLVRKYQPKLVAVDAPLTLPRGRGSIESNNGIHFRQCDLELRKAGIGFFPITLGPMRLLTKRGMRLKGALEKMHIGVIEVFPGASYDLLGVARKDKKEIELMYRKSGLKFEGRSYTQDELDAMCCALTARLALLKKAFPLGGSDGRIWVPAFSRTAGRIDI